MLKQYIAAVLVTAAVLAPVSFAHAQGEGIRISPARAAAIHKCNVLAGRYPETTFSSLEFELYRACMAQHGQVE